MSPSSRNAAYLQRAARSSSERTNSRRCAYLFSATTNSITHLKYNNNKSSTSLFRHTRVFCYFFLPFFRLCFDSNREKVVNAVQKLSSLAIVNRNTAVAVVNSRGHSTVCGWLLQRNQKPTVFLLGPAPLFLFETRLVHGFSCLCGRASAKSLLCLSS